MEAGVAALHIETGRRAAWNGKRPFPMASVYKVPIALEVLLQVEAGTFSLADSLTIQPRDFVGGPNPSVADARGRAATLTVRRLLGFMLTDSDNTASDALLWAVGGPGVVRERMRALGIEGIDVSRYEAEVFAEAAAGRGPSADDPRDAATAEALVRLLEVIHGGAVLSPDSRALLLSDLTATTVGAGRIRGLLPPETTVAHKTGTHTPVTNDVGIVELPDGTHVALAILVMGRETGSLVERELVIAKIARAIYDAFSTGGDAPSVSGA